MNIDPWNIFTASFGQVPKPCTALITLLDMALLFFTTMQVGRARHQHGVQAPATDGPPGFLRAFRVHQNTVEQLVQHLPLLWIAAFAMDDVFAALAGVIWLFGRLLYALRYAKKATRRGKGFAVAMLANAVLLIGALAGVIASF